MIVSPEAEAEADLAGARDYYEGRREGLGDDFLRAVGLTLRQVEQMPEAHSILHKNVRRALTKRFPLAVYYRIEDEEAVVLAVIHSRRDPKDWQSRT